MTTASTQPTRREILKWFSGIPFLPLGAMATAATLAGCNDSDDSSVVTPTPQPSKFKMQNSQQCQRQQLQLIVQQL